MIAVIFWKRRNTNDYVLHIFRINCTAIMAFLSPGRTRDFSSRSDTCTSASFIPLCISTTLFYRLSTIPVGFLTGTANSCLGWPSLRKIPDHSILPTLLKLTPHPSPPRKNERGGCSARNKAQIPGVAGPSSDYLTRLIIRGTIVNRTKYCS